MTKWINNDAWNALLNKIKTADQIWLLSSYADSYAAANSAKLGGKAYSLGTVSFPASTPKTVNLPNVADVPIDRSGQVNHIALVRTGGSELLMVVETQQQTVAQNGKADVSGLSLTAEVL
jgi:hypothetical protein